MTYFFAAFTVLFLVGVIGIPKRLSSANEGFLSRDLTASINGYFISLVFLSHLRTYIPQDAYAPSDQGFLTVIIYLGQLIVTTFLFFSGYGIMESIKHKEGYIRSFPIRRIMPFLLDFWLALFIYLLVSLYMGLDTSLQRVLLSMVGWLNLGNSNWYIFATLWMYVVTYVAFRICDKPRQGLMGIVLVAIGAVLYAELMKHEKVGTWYYSTIMCYPAGMLFSWFRERLEKLTARTLSSTIIWAVLVGCSVAVFLMLHPIRFKRAIIFNVMSVFFALVIALIALRTRHLTRPYAFIGKNLFIFYIYQRVPMMLLSPYVARMGTLFYTTASFILCMVFCLGMIYVHKWYKKIVFT